MSVLAERFQKLLSDRYVIERELGRGGMAVVFLARDVRHDRPVAIKVFRSDVGDAPGAERFQREIRLLARLQHPHILPLYDSGTTRRDELLRQRHSSRARRCAHGSSASISCRSTRRFARGRGRRCARLRPRARCRSSRHQAGEHPPARRPRRRRGLRHRARHAAERRRVDDCRGHVRWQSRVHEPRAGERRPRDRWASRRLQSRVRAVRDARRRTTVHGACGAHDHRGQAVERTPRSRPRASTGRPAARSKQRSRRHSRARQRIASPSARAFGAALAASSVHSVAI